MDIAFLQAAGVQDAPAGAAETGHNVSGDGLPFWKILAQEMEQAMAQETGPELASADDGSPEDAAAALPFLAAALMTPMPIPEPAAAGPDTDALASESSVSAGSWLTGGPEASGAAHAEAPPVALAARIPGQPDPENARLEPTGASGGPHLSIPAHPPAGTAPSEDGPEILETGARTGMDASEAHHDGGPVWSHRDLDRPSSEAASASLPAAESGAHTERGPEPAAAAPGSGADAAAPETAPETASEKSIMEPWTEAPSHEADGAGPEEPRAADSATDRTAADASGRENAGSLARDPGREQDERGTAASRSEKTPAAGDRERSTERGPAGPAAAPAAVSSQAEGTNPAPPTSPAAALQGSPIEDRRGAADPVPPKADAALGDPRAEVEAPFTEPDGAHVRSAELVGRIDGAEMRVRFQSEALGPIELRALIQDGGIAAHLHAERPDIQRLLRAELPYLEQSLNERNLAVDGLSVNDGEDRGSGLTDGREQSETSKRSKDGGPGISPPVPRLDPAPVPGTAPRDGVRLDLMA